MTNCKKTKQALFGSVIALILCLSMLVGTTFAWFTDSVVSGKNQIVAGNLDIVLEYKDGNDWIAVDENTNVFGDSLWEPGHTEVVTLRISNVGTLALKYQMGINVYQEKTSINVYGDELKLSDYIEFGIANGQYATREQAIAAITSGTKLSQGYNVDQVAMLPGATQEITLVAYMPETVGNEANYKTGYEAPEIELGINLMATQLVHEDDSFGNNYDEDAKFAGIPGATVTKLSDMPNVALTDLNSMSQTGKKVDLDVAYNFATTQSYDQAVANQYGKYHADFVVSFDKDVAADTVVLGGQYDSFSADWLAFAIPQAVAANTPYRLLSTAGVTMNYEELCLLVQNFKCGASNLSVANNGTTMTVELRLYEVEESSDANGNSWNVETGASKAFGTYTYTFGNPNDVPAATVYTNPAFVGTNLNWHSQYNMVPADTQLESAYTFSANETNPVSYAKWSADFFVSVDRDIADNQLILAGQYDFFSPDWIGFAAPATAANQKVGLLGTAGFHVNYEEICNLIQSFNCGVADVADALAGATITVELVLTSPDGTQSFVVSTNTYTF